MSAIALSETTQRSDKQAEVNRVHHCAGQIETGLLARTIGWQKTHWQAGDNSQPVR